MKTRPCRSDISIVNQHCVSLPTCCPVSGNPLPGSTLTISYLPNGKVIDVYSLSSWVNEFVGGHPSGTREMESMIQDLAERCAAAVMVEVTATADLTINAGLTTQTMQVVCKAGPQ